MSGICGIVNFDGKPVDPELLRKMAEAAAHRGPDGIRYWIDGNVGLAHLALCATPESTLERQPLLSGNGDLILTADARVDNQDDLIRTLTAKGYCRKEAPTDADLILASYECWGERCSEFIVGDFAFVIWNRRKQTLFGARDVFGTRPFHYAQHGSTLCVASEAQQIVQHPEVPCLLNETAIAHYLVNDCSDETLTVYAQVLRLRPAHWLIAGSAGCQLGRYWDIDPAAQISYKRDEDYAEHFRDTFTIAVKNRLRAQGKTIGVMMSGGLDSCSVAAVAQQILDADGCAPHLLACSHAFDNLERCDERIYSATMADELGIEVEYINAEEHWLLDDPEAFIPALETPFMGWESAVRNALTRFRLRGTRVLMTGHGGDNLLQGSGYTYWDRLLRGHLEVLAELARHARYRNVSYARLVLDYIVRPSLPQLAVKVLHQLAGRAAASRLPTWLGCRSANTAGLSRHSRRTTGNRRFRSLARQQAYERIASLHSVGRAVYWYDRTAAHFGMEARHPFLDRRLAEFVMAIPPEQLFHAGRSKWLLRRAMRSVLPETIRQRELKTGFGDYLDLGLREKEVQQINTLLETPISGKLGFVNVERLHQAYKECLESKGASSTAEFWYPITLELWLKEHHSATQVY